MSAFCNTSSDFNTEKTVPILLHLSITLYFRLRSISWWYLFDYGLQIFLKGTLSHAHLQTFSKLQPKKQFSCKFSENLMTAFVIKMSFHLSV